MGESATQLIDGVRLLGVPGLDAPCLFGDAASGELIDDLVRRDGEVAGGLSQVKDCSRVLTQVGQPVPDTGGSRDDDLLVHYHVPDLDVAHRFVRRPTVLRSQVPDGGNSSARTPEAKPNLQGCASDRPNRYRLRPVGWCHARP